MYIKGELDIPLVAMGGELADRDDAPPCQVTFRGARYVWCRRCRWVGLASELVPEHWNEDDDHGLCPRCMGRAGLRPIPELEMGSAEVER